MKRGPTVQCGPVKYGKLATKYPRIYGYFFTVHYIHPVVFNRDIYCAPAEGAKYCDEYVCLSVCLQNHTAKLHQIIDARCLWPWLGPSLTVLRYVMYFRFCG